MTEAERALVDAALAVTGEPGALDRASIVSIKCLANQVRMERLPPECGRTLEDLTERAVRSEKALREYIAKLGIPSSEVDRVNLLVVNRVWDEK